MNHDDDQRWYVFVVMRVSKSLSLYHIPNLVVVANDSFVLFLLNSKNQIVHNNLVVIQYHVFVPIRITFDSDNSNIILPSMVLMIVVVVVIDRQFHNLNPSWL